MSWPRIPFSKKNLTAGVVSLFAVVTMQSERLRALVRIHRCNNLFALLVKSNPSLTSCHLTNVAFMHLRMQIEQPAQATLGQEPTATSL
jgi:hypothetical protein